jgi:hypothetical protein
MRGTRVIATLHQRLRGNDRCCLARIVLGGTIMRLDEVAALFHHEPVVASFTFLLVTLAVLAAIVAAVMAAHTLKDNVHQKAQSRVQGAKSRRRIQPL